MKVSDFFHPPAENVLAKAGQGQGHGQVKDIGLGQI